MCTIQSAQNWSTAYTRPLFFTLTVSKLLFVDYLGLVNFFVKCVVNARQKSFTVSEWNVCMQRKPIHATQSIRMRISYTYHKYIHCYLFACACTCVYVNVTIHCCCCITAKLTTRTIIFLHAPFSRKQNIQFHCNRKHQLEWMCTLYSLSHIHPFVL